MVFRPQKGSAGSALKIDANDLHVLLLQRQFEVQI